MDTGEETIKDPRDSHRSSERHDRERMKENPKHVEDCYQYLTIGFPE